RFFSPLRWPRLSLSTQSFHKSSGILPENGWPELLPFVFQCVSSDSPKLQESTFLILAQLSQYVGETLTPHIKLLHGMFLQCLSSNSASSDVKIAAFD
ncbi:unnamed protein product, partial [Arabidopsis halleri]